MSKRQLRTDDLVLILCGVVPGAVIGGRLVHVLVYWDAYAASPISVINPSVGGLSLLGAVLGGIVTGIYIARLIGAPVWRWADAAAVPFLLAIGLGKLAQLLGGSGQGLPFDGLWAVAFLGDGPWVSASPEVPAHPAQVYEELWLLIGIPVVLLIGGAQRNPPRVHRLVAWADRSSEEGILLIAALAWFLLGRLVIGFFWRDPSLIGPLNTEQALALFALVGLLGGRFSRRRRRSAAGAAVPPRQRHDDPYGEVVVDSRARIWGPTYLRRESPMSIDVGNVRTRRALLTGAVGGVAALIAHSLGRPSPVLGADVELGGVNSTTATTAIQNSVNDNPVLRLTSIEGVALQATGTGGALLRGRNQPGVTGIQKGTLSLNRVPIVRAGVAGLGEDIGVRGSSANRVGVLGFVGDDDGPANMPPNAGVYGWSTTEGAGVSYGVLGRSTASLGYGVFGTSNTGTGVIGLTKDGTAVAATVSSGGNGRALVVSGPVQFSTSGLATISGGDDRVIVSPGVALNSSTKVLATLMGNPGGTVALRRVAVQETADTFTIILSGAAATAVKVAWFVMR